MADLNLVVRSRQGDREAFSQLYLEYKDSLYRYAWYKIGDPDYAMDAVSDTMLAALEQIGKLKNPKAFSTYLFRIHAASCSHYVKDVIKARESEDLSEVESGLSASDGDFKALELREALAILNDVEKDIVLLSVSGFNSKEIAKVTGYTSGATRSKLSRALTKMRDFLEGKYEKQ